MPPVVIAADGCDWINCAVGVVDEDPDGPGTDWATASGNNATHNGHFSFGTPTQPLVSGADLQEFRASFRRNSTCGTGTPTAQIEIWSAAGGLLKISQTCGLGAPDDLENVFLGSGTVVPKCPRGSCD